MRSFKKQFLSMTEATAFCRLLSQKNYECRIYESELKRRRKVKREIFVSYLRRVKNKKRRIRVSYTLVKYEFKIVLIKVFDVVYFKSEKFVDLEDYLGQIKEIYGISDVNVSYPKKFLKWNYLDNNFWTWGKRYPPYQGIGFFVKVEVWAVVTRNEGKEDEQTFIWSWSRAQGLDYGITWENVLKIKKQIERDIFKMIEEKEDYLSIQEFIGWTAYPRSDWYYKTVKSKSYLAKLYKGTGFAR